MHIDILGLQKLADSLDLNLSDLTETLKDGLLAAYFQSKGIIADPTRPDFDLARSQVGHPVRVNLDMQTGEVSVIVTKLDENLKVISETDDTPADFDRIAANVTRRVIGDRVQKTSQAKTLQDLEQQLYTLQTGTVQQGADTRMVYVNLGKLEAQMPPAEQVPGEKYEHGKRMRVFLVAVRPSNTGSVAIVSRTHPGLLKALFAREVPEIADGTVEIKAVAREAGARSKMAVLSHNSQVAAKGSCIGPKSARVNAVVQELNGEKIDIVDFSEDPAKFIAAALAPAAVQRVEILDETAKQARVFVPDFQLSLAIGKEGQNARLAARLTGWRIDIRSDADPLFQAGATATVGR